MSASIPSATTRGAGGGRWYAAACWSTGATSRSSSALSVGARKSPKSWLDRNVPVPTSTIRRPGAFGSVPLPRSRSTSQRSGVHSRGRWPLVSTDVAAEPFDARERDEMAGDGALAEEDDWGRAWQPDLRQPLANVAVERRVRLVVADGDAEPDRPHRARCGRDPLHRLRDAPVLGDLRAGEDADQDGRPDRDPAGGEQRPGRPAPHAAPGEPDDVEGCPRSASAAAAMPGVVGQGLRPCRGRRGPVCRPPPRRSTRRSARTTAGR